MRIDLRLMAHQLFALYYWVPVSLWGPNLIYKKTGEYVDKINMPNFLVKKILLQSISGKMCQSWSNKNKEQSVILIVSVNGTWYCKAAVLNHCHIFPSHSVFVKFLEILDKLFAVKY